MGDSSKFNNYYAYFYNSIRITVLKFHFNYYLLLNLVFIIKLEVTTTNELINAIELYF